MKAKSRVSRSGTGFTVHIPEELAREWGVQEGSVVGITSSGDSLVIRREPYELSKMLERITPDNLHGEYDFGAPQGKEIW